MSQHKRARKERRREARSIERAKVQLGIKARAEAIKVAIRDPAFDAELNDAIRWHNMKSAVRHVDEVRDLALGCLAARGLDVNGINLKIDWQPGQKQIGVSVGLTMEAAQQAQAAAELRRVRVEG